MGKHHWGATEKSSLDKLYNSRNYSRFASYRRNDFELFVFFSTSTVWRINGPFQTHSDYTAYESYYKSCESSLKNHVQVSYDDPSFVPVCTQKAMLPDKKVQRTLKLLQCNVSIIIQKYTGSRLHRAVTTSTWLWGAIYFSEKNPFWSSKSLVTKLNCSLIAVPSVMVLWNLFSCPCPKNTHKKCDNNRRQNKRCYWLRIIPELGSLYFLKDW